LLGLLDVLTLQPHGQVTKVYEVPGTKLSISVDAAGVTGSDGVDILVYGWSE
jgi:type III secretion protein HrpB1